MPEDAGGFSRLPTLARRPAAVLVAAALVAGACGGGGAGGETPSEGSERGLAAAEDVASGPEADGPGRVVIRMLDDMTFDPGDPTLSAGDTVVWVNEAGLPHTTTGDPAAATLPEHARLPGSAEPWDSGVVEAGGSFERVFALPGSYTYLCTLHEALGMIGRLEVRNGSRGAAALPR